MTRGDYVPLEKGNLSITSKRQRSESISGKRKRGSLCLYLVASVAAITLLIFISGPAAQYNRLVGQSADQFSCGQARCRFLLVTAVSEGESKVCPCSRLLAVSDMASGDCSRTIPQSEAYSR